MSEPKLLFWDCETSANKVWTFPTYKAFIAPGQVIEPMRVICWAAKRRKPGKIQFMSEFHDNPKAMIKGIHALLSDADAVVTYNGVSFDNKMVAAEFAKAGLPPVPPTKQIDLYRVVKKHFRLPSYKLEYVAQFFGIGEKVKHQGFDLWKQCAAGDAKAWATMKRYNCVDTRLLEALYEKLLPYIHSHPSHGVLKQSPVCVNCGSRNLQKRGKHVTKTGVFQRLSCQSCGTWQRERTNELPKGAEVLVGL